MVWYNAVLGFIFMVLAFNILLRSRKLYRNLPPSPPGSLPILGHLHLIKNHLHRTLYNFSQKHGPIFTLRFGSRLVVVVSSSSLVEECFTKNDLVLANRPKTAISKYFGYNNTTIIFAPYGDHWRNLRRICDTELFSPIRLNKLLSIRHDEVRHLLFMLYNVSFDGFAKVDLGSKITEVTFNIITKILANKRYYGDEMKDDEEATRFRGLIKDALELSGASNPGDFFPILGWMGFNSYEKKLAWHKEKGRKFMEGLIEEHRLTRGQNTMVDHMLSLQALQPEKYTDEIIIGLIIALIVAGTDASAITTEWAMSLLLNHPEALQRAGKEIDAHVGHERLVEEQDLSKLSYLHCIILETLRLFPSVPMLVPHESSEKCEIGGYNVPKGTMILINAWAIQRDPNVWADPLSFKPERFGNINGEAHKLLAFGMGRRACPGAGLAQKIIGLALGSLVQCFEWERISDEEIDLAEGYGITLPKAQPLEALCRPRSVMAKVLQGLVSTSY